MSSGSFEGEARPITGAAVTVRDDARTRVDNRDSARRLLRMLLIPLLVLVPHLASDKEVRTQFVDLAAKQDREACVALFKALSDPNRVLIVNLLANAGEPVCVCDLNVQLELSQPTVSHHLKKLVEAGLVTREQRGVWADYAVDRSALGRLATVFDVGTVEGRSTT